LGDDYAAKSNSVTPDKHCNIIIRRRSTYSPEIFNPGDDAHRHFSSLRLGLRTRIHRTVEPATACQRNGVHFHHLWTKLR